MTVEEWERRLRPYETVYFDMDGVLCDINHALCLRLGIPMGSPHGRVNTTGTKKSREDVHEVFASATEEWWANLPPLKEGIALWHAIPEKKRCILTSPSRHGRAQCSAGKTRWVETHLGNPVSMVLTDEKWRLSHQRTVLLDDTSWQTFVTEGDGDAIFWRGLETQWYV